MNKEDRDPLSTLSINHSSISLITPLFQGNVPFSTLFSSQKTMDTIWTCIKDVTTCLWQCIAPRAAYIYHLEKNLTSLDEEMTKLMILYKDVKDEIKLEEEQRKIPTGEVEDWVATVEEMNNDVNKIREEGLEELQQKCLGNCCRKVSPSTYELGKNVSERIEATRKLVNDKQSFTIIARAMPRAVAYVLDLEVNLTSLGEKMAALKVIYNDVNVRIKLAIIEEKIPTKEVSAWVEAVDKMEKEVDVVMEMGPRELPKKSLGNRFPEASASTYEFGRRVSGLIDAIDRELRDGKSFNVIARGRAVMDVMPVEKTVGLETKLDEVWNCIHDEKLSVIGLCGMGGVGKTTLMKKLTNEFVKRKHDFEEVIWVVVSREGNGKVVQNILAEKFKLPAGQNKHENVTGISRYLRGKKFVLLLDDVWETIDITELGVPLPDENMSKIIITSRKENVCNSMGADKIIKVECLTEEEAIDLFREKVGAGKEELRKHPQLSKLIDAAARKCAGMPLALITIGRAMAGKMTIADWERVLILLKDFPVEPEDPRQNVFRILSFSYECLPDDTQRKCFIYCSMFPEDYDIDGEELINFWIAEGILDRCQNVDKARNLGLTIIEDLKRACLLLSGKSETSVMVHDVIREMALWIASDRGKKGINYVVKSLGNQLPVEEWKMAERASFFGLESFEVSGEITFPNLMSFWVRDSLLLQSLPGGLFHSMSAIKVLDLSQNVQLTHLPSEIGTFVLLQYLNLSNTEIIELPERITEFAKLRYLGLRNTRSLKTLPRDLRRLTELLVLDTWNCGEDQSDFGRDLIQELENMKKLVHPEITIKGRAEYESFMGCQRLQSVTRAILIKECNNVNSFTLLNHVKCLEVLEIDGCSNLEKFTNLKQTSLQKLHTITIRECPKLLYLSWIVLAPNLRSLMIINCHSLEEVIQSDGSEVAWAAQDVGMFSCLENLKLIGAQNLKYIYNKPLPFPRLKEIQMFECPALNKLPFDVNSADSLMHMVVPPNWWKALQWTDEATKAKFSTRVELQIQRD